MVREGASLLYPWILFDADGTLFDYDRAESTALLGLWEAAGYPRQAGLLDTYRRVNGALWKQFEAGKVTAAEIKVRRFVTLLEELDLEGEPEMLSSIYLQLLGRQTHLLPGAEELLEWLADRRQLALITNGLTTVQRSRLSISSIGHRFEVVVISEEVGYAKPDRRIFERAIAAMKVEALEDVLMVGDNLAADIEGGRRSGLATCWLNLGGRATSDGFNPTHEIHSLVELRSLLGE